jgi:hypothetical protein
MNSFHWLYLTDNPTDSSHLSDDRLDRALDQTLGFVAAGLRTSARPTAGSAPAY